MQSRNFFRLSTAVILITCLASCHKKNTQGRLIPKDAAIVFVADGKSIFSKVSWDEIKQNPLIQKALADSSTAATIKSVITNPDNSGADIKSDIIFYLEKDSTGGYTALEGSVKDPALFKTYCTQVMNGGTESEKDGVSYISKYPICVGWSKDKFIIISDEPSFGNRDAYSRRMMDDSIDITMHRDIGSTCKSIFALEESNTLAVNDKFSKLLKETGDLHFWINTGNLYSQMLSSKAGPLAMVNFGDLYKDNVTTAAVSFDNGKISINTKSYMNEKLLAIYKQYTDGKISDEMLQRLPGKDVTGAVALNFKPAGIKEILKQMNLDGMANLGLAQANLTLDDILNAFKGDFVFGATDYKLRIDSMGHQMPDGYSYKSAKETNEGNFIFAASIGDKDAFNKVFNTAKGLLAQSAGPDADAKLPFSFDNNGTYFVVGNTKDGVSKYMNGGTNNFDFINKIDGHAFGAYVNIHSLLLGFQDIKRDSSSEAVYEASLKTWNTVYWKSEGMSGDEASGSAEINLLDNATNSLKQLNQYAIKLSEIYKEEKDKKAAEELKYEEEELKMDSAAVPVMPSTN